MHNKKDNWGNQELPGISNEELLSDEFAKKISAAETSERTKILHQDPVFRDIWKKKNEERYSDPEYSKKVGKQISNTYNTPEGKAKQAVKAKSHSQETKELIRQIQYERPPRSTETRKKLSNAQIGNKKRCRPIRTPIGDFGSLKEAGEAYIPIKGSNALRHVEKWLKTDTANFYYLK
jgi:hypothetical protein